MKFVDSGNFIPAHPPLPDPFPATYGSVTRESMDKVVAEFRAHQVQLIRAHYGIPPDAVIKDEATSQELGMQTPP